MLAERGCARVGDGSWSRSLARGLERRAGDDEPVEGGMLCVQNHLARLEMRIAGTLGHVGDGRAWHARLAKQFEPMVARPGGEMTGQNRVQFRVIRRALG